VSLGTVSAVAFDVGRNTTTNLLDASSGYVLNGHLEQAGSWLWGTFNYWAAAGEGRYYHTIGHSVVLANKLRFGAIDPVNGLVANVPFYKRFFLGGAASLRGWGRFEVSPLLNGEPVGGFTVVEGSSEVRFPLTGKFGAVLFLDLGNVWENAWQFNVGDLRYAVGPGLRYLTPVGPLRIDLGYQLTPIAGLLVNGEPQKRQWRLHFSIGQAF
jgi:outer membrane translocation and assembly module TamA